MLAGFAWHVVVALALLDVWLLIVRVLGVAL